MAVLVDVNTLPCVLNANNKQHSDFSPVLDWVLDGKGKIVYGGSTFLMELKKLPRYLKVLELLGAVKKSKCVDSDLVDDREETNKRIEPSSDFDDPHLVALVAVWKIPIYCSNDARCFRFMNDSRFYDRPTDRPKIFTNVGHPPQVSLLSDDALVPNLGPYSVLSPEVRSRIRAALPGA